MSVPEGSERALVAAASPVRAIPGDDPGGPVPGIALCLSGGGYRAMLFHLGALWRLNELGYLPRLDRVSSVSGGSITAGALAAAWDRLQFGADGVAARFVEEVAEPIHRMAGETVDKSAIVRGVLLPGSVADRVVGAYKRHLLGDKTLQDLPDRPRFVINATNLQSGVLWRFSKPYMWDYRVGKVERPTESVATAVAASSAFPPFLSPLRLSLDPARYEPGTGVDLQRPEFQRKPMLTDGGVYDNLGLETAWKRYRTVLVSDGGGHYGADANVPTDWARQLRRVLGTIDNQVRSLRKRQVVGSLAGGVREGAYWSIWSEAADFGLDDPLNLPDDRAKALAHTPTRLKEVEQTLQRRLVNWGYGICDTAMRRHVEPAAPKPGGFPYPEEGL